MESYKRGSGACLPLPSTVRGHTEGIIYGEQSLPDPESRSLDLGLPTSRTVSDGL
jgi:hypothetical protein